LHAIDNKIAAIAVAFGVGTCAQNIHNTIHILVPSSSSSSQRGDTAWPQSGAAEGSATAATATLINPRIGAERLFGTILCQDFVKTGLG
jgi:hypothetical protein